MTLALLEFMFIRAISQNMTTRHGQISEMQDLSSKYSLVEQTTSQWGRLCSMKTWLENELESLPAERQNESLHRIGPEKNPGTWFKVVPGNLL